MPSCRRLLADANPQVRIRQDQIIREINPGSVNSYSDYVQPIPGTSGISFLRTNRGFEAIRKEWEDHLQRFLRYQPKIFNKLAKKLNVLDLEQLREQTILDAGTGDGAFTENLKMEGVDIVGIDLVLREDQRRNDYFFERNVSNTGFPSHSFDLIVSSYSVFHYFDYTHPRLYSDSLREMSRLLKPGGKLLIIRSIYGQKEITTSKEFKVIYPDANQRHHDGEYFLLEKKRSR
jgi:SAM-dependent methyltransferase